MLTAHTTDEAFEVLATDRVAVVVSDYRMGKMNGNEFLKRVRRLRPDATRIMLSGRSDMHSVIDAVNLGAIHRFVEKPICWETLEEVMLEGIQYHDDYSRQRRPAGVLVTIDPLDDRPRERSKSAGVNDDGR
ncbi:MAG: DNA-binding NtrC family response regulator [Gammaproteobacteria bacterium]